jgi:group I intron endonuclease
MGYIYMLTSPNGKSYIGQTTRPIQTRFKEHRMGKCPSCRLIYNAIKFHGWDNFEKDWYECPDEDLNIDEELLVREMETMSPGGYNLKEGGGANGRMSGETRQKMSESKTGEKNHNYGKPLSDESKQKNRDAHFGKRHTDKTKQKMSESKTGEKNQMYGKTHTEETIQKMSELKSGEKNSCSKKVYQYDLGGKYVQSFGSCGEAGLCIEKDSSIISKCARNKRKTAYGFKWSYVQIII